MPELSVIVGMYNDWIPLQNCLRSLAEQLDAPTFEVIVVDDGSSEPAPSTIHSWKNSFPLTITREEHAGVASARNMGIRMASAPFLIFTDADCQLDKHCLAALHVAIAKAESHNYYQLHLVGDPISLSGRAEELRLQTLQQQLLCSDGRIRYLNTSGFAMRKTQADIEKGVFEPAALRSEDTVLLAELMKKGELPLFIAQAIVRHSPQMNVLACLGKDMHSAYLERKGYAIIAAKGVRLRMTYRQRFRMLAAMWKNSSVPSIGRAAWVVVFVRQILRFVLRRTPSLV